MVPAEEIWRLMPGERAESVFFTAWADIPATDVVVHWPRESEPYRADRDDFVRAVSCR